MAYTGTTPIVSKEKEAGIEMGISADTQSPPDYGSSPQHTNAPPSYDSIFAKIQEAKQKSDTPVHFVGKTFGLLLSTVMATLCLALSLAVPVTMIVLGALYYDDCPLERMIPIYLIVAGSFYVVKTLIDLAIRECRRRRKVEGQDCEENNDKLDTKVGDWFSGSIGCFLFGFFIAGNVWVYGNYAPSNDPTSARYCNGTLYYFAFWVITSAYIMMGLALCGVSLCCVAACTAICGCKASGDAASKETAPATTP